MASSGSSIRSTVYVSNLPFDLTNIDVRRIFEQYGQIARVTILKERESRKSKGVAFIMFGSTKEADQCCAAVNNTEMFGRTLKVSIAKDNGKGEEFGKRRDYPDKSRCYECGEEGHMSYNCPKNVLGDKSPPRKVGKSRNVDRSKRYADAAIDSSEWDCNDGEDDRLRRITEGQNASAAVKRKKYKQSAYFSDDEELDD
ncbi:zinc finger CCHC-type and RNA-binding motif-containing protein 1-like [Uranotaenia lowii]|uniref:zinc finger CCHC-type and RNA-binding motif-containing protein 1-like n=1 Tax=Uranotaenia lowii TaxID=190385 RepID=UPI0024794B10|nr:zinc finger CCHC-type and RNA-binding motif-containing protein 1-like [Uranotaenia lowii]